MSHNIYVVIIYISYNNAYSWKPNIFLLIFLNEHILTKPHKNHLNLWKLNLKMLNCMRHTTLASCQKMIIFFFLFFQSIPMIFVGNKSDLSQTHKEVIIRNKKITQLTALIKIRFSLPSYSLNTSIFLLHQFKKGPNWGCFWMGVLWATEIEGESHGMFSEG